VVATGHLGHRSNAAEEAALDPLDRHGRLGGFGQGIGARRPAGEAPAELDLQLVWRLQTQLAVAAHDAVQLAHRDEAVQRDRLDRVQCLQRHRAPQSGNWQEVGVDHVEVSASRELIGRVGDVGLAPSNELPADMDGHRPVRDRGHRAPARHRVR